MDLVVVRALFLEPAGLRFEHRKFKFELSAGSEIFDLN